jgi:hypothetical protein
MIDLYSIFCKIKPVEGDDKFFSVEDVPSLPHKLGCSQELYPIFFVECCDDTPSTNINLKQFSVNFNQVCNLRNDEGKTISKKYTIILLKSLEGDIQKYFLDLVYIVLKKLPVNPTVVALKHEIAKVISLFTAPPAFSKEVIKGLWAELFTIVRGQDPLYLINSWHISPEDKYDFNDGIDKVEVKATKNQERIHTFAIEQLNPNKDSKLIIASVIAATSGQGVNVFDLIDAISERVTDVDAILKLKEITYQTIGPHLEESRKLRFDASMAANTYRLFNHYDIPSIPLSAVPIEVSNVHFSACLKNIEPADTTTTESKLHKAL